MLFSEKIRLKIHKFRRRSKSKALEGNNVTCNCCDKSFVKFLSKGNGILSRENAECPNCGSLERTRMLLHFLQNEISIFNAPNTLLHIAPEDSLKQIFKKHSNIQYINGDINPNYADEVIDVTQINYPDNHFDFIICSHVLGHVPDEHKSLTELHRVLKPNGNAFILTLINTLDVPTLEDSNFKTEEQRLKNYGEKDLVRLHGNDFVQRLEKANFKVEPIAYAKVIDQELVEKYALRNDERGTIFSCSKI